MPAALRGRRSRAALHARHRRPAARSACRCVFLFFGAFSISHGSHALSSQVKGIIAEQLGVEIASVVPGASFTEDLGADSLDAVELIMAIEEAFDIEIPDEEAETMTTPADCVTAITAKLS